MGVSKAVLANTEGLVIIVELAEFTGTPLLGPVTRGIDVENCPLLLPELPVRGVVAFFDGAGIAPLEGPLVVGRVSVMLGEVYIEGPVPISVVVKKVPVLEPSLLERGVVELTGALGDGAKAEVEFSEAGG